MKLKLIKKVILKQQLVNSISILDHSIYYSSSLNNSISKYDLTKDTDTTIVGGKCGYGKYKFREPVHALAYKENDNVVLVVSDWHNHRVIKYSNGNYITEIGMFSPTTSKLKNIAKFIRGLSTSGSYITSHFSINSTKHVVKTSFVYNLIYIISSSIRLLSKRFYDINKPNGTCFYKDGLIFTQKNSNRLTFVDFNLNAKADFITPVEGRLGNVNNKKNEILLCIESLGSIYKINNDGVFSKIALVPLDIDFKPFSACFLHDDLLAVISMSNLHIYDVNSGLEICRYTVNGELHGLEIYDNNIYIADRVNGEVSIMRVSYD
jgi:hypothetical protein